MSFEDKKPDSSLDNLDLNLLRVFLVLMQERSVTKASRVLGRTQSAVSHSLAKLREFFEDELFTRGIDSMEPTARARELAEVISSSLADINGAVERQRKFDPKTTKRNFRIGVNDYTALAYVPELTKELARLAPHATLNFINTYDTQVESLIRNGEIDYAIVAAYGLLESKLELIPLSRDRLLCVGWAENPQLQRPMTLDDYLMATHVQISSDGVSPGAADRALQVMGLRRKVSATVSHYSVAPSILKGSNLLTILGDSILFALPEDCQLVGVPTPFKMRPLSICLVFDSSIYRDEGHRWIRDLIIDIWKRQGVLKRERMGAFMSSQ